MTTWGIPEDRLTLRIPEAAKILGIGRDTAYRAAKEGTLPTLRLGHRIVVPVPQLLALLGADQTPTHSEGEPASSPLAALVRHEEQDNHDTTSPGAA